MTRVASPLRSAVAAVSADADGAVTITFAIRHYDGDAPGDVERRSFRLDAAEVARLERWLALRVDGPFTISFPPKSVADDGSDA